MNNSLNSIKIVEPSVGDWHNTRLCLSGEKDGFKWYVGEYDLPFNAESVFHPNASTVVRLAYVDVTGTKLDGIVDSQVIDNLGIELHCGCTFAGAGESARLLKNIKTINKDNWFVGEDYAHDLFGHSEKSFTPDKIAKHLEFETIPSIIRALVFLDVKNPNFDGLEIFR